MRAYMLILIAAVCVALPIEAQEKKFAAKPVPVEHKEFVAEVQALAMKHPKSAARFGLADLGEGNAAQPAAIIIIDCGDLLREKKFAAKPVPVEHKEFVAEVQALAMKHPKSAARFGLADLGEGNAAQPAAIIIIDCGGLPR